jgi:hypothetical protein
MTIEDADRLKKPKTKYGYIESPKYIISYLKAGCEIRQTGKDRLSFDDRTPEYSLVSPGMAWVVRLHEIHVRALETLELIIVDSCGGGVWYSRANFSIPSIADDVTSSRFPPTFGIS